jgi:hypothetical protein
MVLGSGTPVYRHYSEQAARNEAERLARLHPPQKFTVLESVDTVCSSGVRWSSDEVKKTEPEKPVGFTKQLNGSPRLMTGAEAISLLEKIFGKDNEVPF